MNFIFECSTRYLTSERSDYINLLITTFLTVFEDFQPLSEDFLKLLGRVNEHFRTFPNIFHNLPTISEDFREGTDDVSIM